MSDSNSVPLMYQAQIAGRGQIQYIAESEQAYQWVQQWEKGLHPSIPTFAANTIKTVEKSIPWRFITNSGQDEALIRPVIGARGYPFYPGSSMKGAFRRACQSDAEKLRYCGGEVCENGLKRTQPGILRFHGGYLVNSSSMGNCLVDIVHPQEDWQVKTQAKHSAKILISLYKPSLIFGFSSTEELSEIEWTRIKEIWSRAMEKGIGSRTSAGYGQVKDQGTNRLIKVNLTGQGIASKLPNNQTPELRSNMFKAALRGHTLRLFGGVTDAKTA